MLPDFIVSAMLQNAFLAASRRLPEITAIILREVFVFFQEGGELSTTLRQVTVQITSDSECNSAYADYWDFTDRMICAGDSNGGKGPCWVIGL
jgi:hypothetical protein